jgi:histidine triad (HIT) family protein
MSVFDSNNIFSKILRKELPCALVFEDDIAFSFMDAFPQAEGHTLVIPKAVTAADFLGMPSSSVGPYMERVHRIAKAVDAALQPDGVQIMQFNRAAAGQTVFYPHFHIIPRREGGALTRHASGKMADIADLEPIARRIREAL